MMKILQAVNNISKAFAQITSEENKHKKFNNIVDFMLCLYYAGKDREKQEITPKEEEIFANSRNVVEATDIDKYYACIQVIISMYEQLPYADILGEFFQMEISGQEHEQFFTPDEVCNLMAQMSIPEIKKGLRVNDDCCGSGSTLLAGAKYIASQQEKTQIRPQDCLFIGKDIDDRCVRVTLLNLCLHKLKGFLTCGDTLLGTTKYQIFIDYTFPREKGNGQAVWFLGKMSQWVAQPLLNGQSHNVPLLKGKAVTEHKQQEPIKEPTKETQQEPATMDLTKINEQLTLF